MLFDFPVETWLIMAVEFTERSAYYGVAFMLMTYCTTMLRWTPSAANAFVNALYAIAPASACVSSGIADGRWGRPLSLVILLVLYCLGIGMIALSSYPFLYHEFPENATDAGIALFITGMIFFAVGYGGVKVCTNPLMADGVAEVYKYDEQLRLSKLSQLFRLIYWVTNCGSLLGIFLPPFLRQLEKRRVVIGSDTYTTGYYLGFSMSAGLCLIGLVMLLITYSRLKKNEPSPPFVLARILFRAISVRWRFAIGRIRDDAFLNAHRCDLIQFAGYRSPQERNCSMDLNSLDRSMWPRLRGNGEPVQTYATESDGEKLEQQDSAVKKQSNVEMGNEKTMSASVSDQHAIDSSVFDLNDVSASGWIADAKAALAACRVFITMPIYWLITNRFSTDIVLQTESTNLPGSTPPEVFNNINTITLLVSLVLFDRVIFPWLYPHGKPPVRGRVITGFLFMIASVIWCGVVQIFVDRRGTYDDSGKYSLYPGESRLQAAWLVTPFVLQGIASALVDTTVLEVAYVSAPVSMKGAVMALYLVASSVSGFLGLALSPFLKPTNAMIIFFSLGAALGVVTILFYYFNRHKNVTEFVNSDDKYRKPVPVAATEVPVSVRDQCRSEWETQYLLCKNGTPSGASSKRYSGTPSNSEESSVPSRP